ncbi:MAG: hypothetical protein EORIYHIE_001709 [Candidatus Fervidibacter sp.]|jgi:hypothetical protein
MGQGARDRRKGSPTQRCNLNKSILSKINLSKANERTPFRRAMKNQGKNLLEVK